ncbi:coagulation factor V [Megalops cyprinoides]|uniref:coagulation factor V n=1 Tax=Megalops cyprinoides TaxID=118141 RepID=UPI001863EB1C|nr:coagulation factor V [Megalops cyprinoides]
MRLCSWSGAPLLLLGLLLHSALAVERHYYIAAVHINWTYTAQDGQSSGPTYKKVVFREYDAGFKQAKAHPPWLGLLGPTLRGQKGDVIKVTFRNMADRPYSLHPHGIAYVKQSEGSLYFDNTSLFEKEDDEVCPGKEHTYTWEVTDEVAPTEEDPPCLTYTYISHYDIVKDFNSGLIGTLLVCKEGSLSDTGEQLLFSQEYVLLFGVFDESESWYTTGLAPTDSRIKYTINGYMNGSIPDLKVCAYTSVSWHLLGMSSEPEVFSVHFNGQVMLHSGHKVSTVGLISGSSTSGNITTAHPGQWLVSSIVSGHMEAGMYGYLNIEECEEIPPPRRKITMKQRRQSQEWTYYIAAEEVIWDYAPTMAEYIDSDYKSKYLKSSSDRIGQKYKKAVFTQYTDETFKERAENKQRKMETGILGPVIRAQIRDIVKIVFKNKASRPYSIYPHGLTIDKMEEGFSYPDRGNQTSGVQPGQTHTYEWKVIEEDEPTDSDSRCLTRMYHSAVDPARDIASGLVGPLLICKSQSLDKRNAQLKADKEQHAMLVVFDENKSWYIDENIKSFCGDPSRVNKEDPEFYKSNVMHSINGYVYDSGQVLGFCNGEIVTWHMSSVGAQDYIQTATFYGHSFELNDRPEDLLSLFPMTGETIHMNMDNIGHWLLASLSSHETQKGVRVKFKDLECYLDYDYNEKEETDILSVNTWRPEDIDEIRKPGNEKPTEKTSIKYEVDDYTDSMAELLGLRSFKNKSQGLRDDVELLDFSLLDSDDQVFPVGNTTENLSSYTTLHYLTHPELGSNEKPRNLSLAERAKVNGDIMERGSFNETLNTTGKAADSADLWTNATTMNESVAETTSMELQVNKTTMLVLQTNITAEISYAVEGVATDAVLSQLNGSSEEIQKEATPVKEGTSHVEKPEVSGDKATGNDLFTYTVPFSKIFPSSTQMEMNNTDKEEFVLLDSTVTEEIFTGYDKNVVDIAVSEAKFPYSSSVATTIPDEGQKALPENATLDSGGNIFTAEATVCNSSCAKDFTAFDAEIGKSDVMNNISKSLEMITSTEQGNYSLLPEATSTLGLDGGNETAMEDKILPKIQVHNETSSASSSDEEAVWNVVMKAPGVEHWNSSEEVAYENEEDNRLMDRNITFSHGLMNVSSSHNMLWNVDVHMGNLSLTVSGPLLDRKQESNSSSEEEMLPSTDSKEEVIIYLKNNSEEVTLTSSLDHQKEHWSYDGNHQLVPMETKNTRNESEPNLDDSKVRQGGKEKQSHGGRKPPGSRIKKKRLFKPRSRSMDSGGPEFSPRGMKPMSNEDLKSKSIVIVVPRRDFNDYELYIPNLSEESELVDIPNEGFEDTYEYVDYKDPYSQQGDIKDIDETTKYYLKMAGDNVKPYFIAAEEVEWDYAGYGQRRQERTNIDESQTKFTKVVFRSYLDSSFSTADIRGEVDEHLGILGPIIKAEVDQTIMVVFRNLASRPYSLHAHGVSYTKQMEGLKYDDESPYWYKHDNEVQPKQTYTYIWKVDPKIGPKPHESDCRTWAYYSGVNPEKDINSGLIGPLLICRKGTLAKHSQNMREFVLLFMTFDETKSWYYEKNVELIQRKNKKAAVDHQLTKNLKFPAINGIVFSLKGLRMYTNQLVRWHLFNMGSQKDLHSVHFHGQTFLDKQIMEYRQGVYPLLPGGFATLEMWPSKPGLWQLESDVGGVQQRGMQTLFLVIDNSCGHPLGLVSQSVKDSQITASHHTGEWKPHLARLYNTGKYNAWSTERNTANWIQVDFKRPVVISKVATQGAKQFFTSHYVMNYTISYSTDRRKWTFYKGNSNFFRMSFTGNQDSHDVKENTFFPPLIGRFIRLHPHNSYNRPTVRLEYYGCELDGCSVPLGMESGRIKDEQITASSTASSWFVGPWHPWFARLNKQGAVNAWQAKTNNMQQWLQVELKEVMKITGIVTQGAKSLGTEMYVTEYIIEYSKNGKTWTKYKEDEHDPEPQVFLGNSDNNGHMKNYIYPPIFARFIKIIPRRWESTITMRIELLGCDFK